MAIGIVIFDYYVFEPIHDKCFMIRQLRPKNRAFNMDLCTNNSKNQPEIQKWSKHICSTIKDYWNEAKLTSVVLSKIGTMLFLPGNFSYDATRNIFIAESWNSAWNVANLFIQKWNHKRRNFWPTLTSDYY